VLSPKPRPRTSLTNEEIIRDIQTKEEEKISHVDSGKGSNFESGKGSKSPHSVENRKGSKVDKNGDESDNSVTSSSSSSSDENDENEMSDDHQKQRRKVVGSVGDIYTKVAMPRSQSFMNVGGSSGGQKRHYNLQELFRELKEKEGVQSIDDILRHVVSPEGMSFNQMSPVYKELLLKLVMSMSRDELFIRSKNIMDQEKMKSGGTKPDSGGIGLKPNLEALLQQTSATTVTTAPSTVTKSSGFGSLLGFKKPFLSRKSKSNNTTETTHNNASKSNNNNNNNNNNNTKGKKSTLGLSVGSKANFTSTGSVSSRRKNSSKRRRGKITSTNNAENVKNSVDNNNDKNNEAPANNVQTAAAAKSAKKKFSKSDISQPIPVIDL
jgi:hypothetical protein